MDEAYHDAGEIVVAVMLEISYNVIRDDIAGSGYERRLRKPAG